MANRKVYLSFSKETHYISKSDIVDLINLHTDIECHSFWGGSYDRSELIGDADFLLVVSWDRPAYIDKQQKYSNSAFASRGVFEECMYAIRENIPAYLLCSNGCPPDVRNLEFKEVISGELRDTKTWTDTYGLLKLKDNSWFFQDLYNLHVGMGGTFTDIKVNPFKLHIGAAKLLNLI